MSFTTIFVEYEDRNNNWNLLESYIPLEKACYSRIDSESVVKFGDKSFYKSNFISRDGVLRDLFNDQNMAFFGRGFPGDLSSGLDEILQFKQAKIDLLNSNDNSINHDNRYGKSWCYLSELMCVLLSMYNDILLNYVNLRFEKTLNDINNKVESIKNLIKSEDVDSKFNVIKTTILPRYDIGPDEEGIHEILKALEFCYYVEHLVEFIAGPVDSANIRLVFYTE